MHSPTLSTYMTLAFPHKLPCEVGTPLPPFLEGRNTGPGDSNNQPKSAAAKPAQGVLTTGLAVPGAVLIEASVRSSELFCLIPTHPAVRTFGFQGIHFENH